MQTGVKAKVLKVSMKAFECGRIENYSATYAGLLFIQAGKQANGEETFLMIKRLYKANRCHDFCGCHTDAAQGM